MMRRKNGPPGHDHPLRTPGPALEAGLKRAREMCGPRLTEIREAVLRLMLEHGGPVTAYELLDRLSLETGRARNPPTIYRALEFLVEAGLVTRLESRNAFTVCTHPGEVHSCVFFLCRCCGEATELVDAEIESRLSLAARGLDFVIDHPVVEVEGLCRLCHHDHRSRGPAPQGDGI